MYTPLPHSLPLEYKDPKSPKTKYDLTRQNLPCDATFISEAGKGLCLCLAPAEWDRNREGDPERVDGTAVKVRFVDGHLAINNKKLLQMVMGMEAYARGMIRIDPDDPTGFWRQTGHVKVKEVKIAIFDTGTHPAFDDIDVSKIKAVDKPEPLFVIKEDRGL